MLVLVALVVLFSLIDAPTPTAQFMVANGDQLPTALYSAVEMTYIAIVIARSAVAVLRGFRSGDGLGRLYWLFVVGAGRPRAARRHRDRPRRRARRRRGRCGRGLSTLYTPVSSARWSCSPSARPAASCPTPHGSSATGGPRRRFRVLEPELRRLETASGNTGLYFTIVWQRRQWRSRQHRLSVEIEDRAREAGQDVRPRDAHHGTTQGDT